MRFISTRLELDGTNAVDFDLTTPALAIDIAGRSDTVTIEVTPSKQSNPFQLRGGRSYRAEAVGTLIQPTVIRFNASAAVTVDVVVTYP